MLDGCALFGALLLSPRQLNVARHHGQGEATRQLGLITCSPCICVATITTFIAQHARGTWNSCATTPAQLPTLQTLPSLFTSGVQTDISATDANVLDNHVQFRQVLSRTLHTRQSIENIRGRMSQLDNLYGLMTTTLDNVGERVTSTDDRTSRLKEDFQTFRLEYGRRLPRYVEASDTIVAEFPQLLASLTRVLDLLHQRLPQVTPDAFLEMGLYERRNVLQNWWSSFATRCNSKTKSICNKPVTTSGAASSSTDPATQKPTGWWTRGIIFAGFDMANAPLVADECV